MFLIAKEIEFDAGHRVPLHESKCRNPHGHRYKVKAVLRGELITEGPESGMVKDFSHVKDLMMKRIHDRFDHSFFVSHEDKELIAAFMPFRFDWQIIVTKFHPTAECLAKHFYELLKPDMPNLISLTVWETPTSTAMYTEEEA